MMRLLCWLGVHRWGESETGRWWRCQRCGAEPRPCRNCHGQHDPTATVVVCTVTL